MANISCKGSRRRGYVTCLLQIATVIMSASTLGSVAMAASPSVDRRAISKLTQEWLTQGWRHLAEDPAFDFKTRLGRFYDWTAKDVYLFDDFDPQKRIARSPADYGAVWNAALPALKTFSNRVIGEPDIQVAGDLAVETVIYEITFELGDGKVRQNRILDTVVWRRGAAGWKIIREQGSGLLSKVLP